MPLCYFPRRLVRYVLLQGNRMRRKVIEVPPSITLTCKLYPKNKLLTTTIAFDSLNTNLAPFSPGYVHFLLKVMLKLKNSL